MCLSQPTGALLSGRLTSAAVAGEGRLDMAGVAVAYHNRMEFSCARQPLDQGNLARRLGLPENRLSQAIVAIKAEAVVRVTRRRGRAAIRFRAC